MGNNLANTDGTLSDRSPSYYQARAKGGFGLITIESTVVYKEAKGGPRKPCLFSDDTVESFRRVAAAPAGRQREVRLGGTRNPGGRVQ